jgi:ferritin-like metal-binding protein YciE
LTKLYVHELKDLWSAEKQIVEAMDKSIPKVRDAGLQEAMRAHLEQTRGQQRRLETIFKGLDFEPGGHHCNGMEGLLSEASEILSSEGETAVLEAGLISALQRVEHYEIAAYGSARAYAEKLGRRDDADLLSATLEEEGQADRLLTQIAERRLNFEALVS